MGFQKLKAVTSHAVPVRAGLLLLLLSLLLSLLLLLSLSPLLLLLLLLLLAPSLRMRNTQFCCARFSTPGDLPVAGWQGRLCLTLSTRRGSLRPWHASVSQV